MYNEWPSPAATDKTPELSSFTGLVRSVVVKSPNWLEPLAPKPQRLPSSLMKKLWELPDDDEVALISPKTGGKRTKKIRIAQIQASGKKPQNK